ncbi:MAG: patatin-like phospholipase family protein [Candidatus Omnitrophica bacterium]|nr:patatin-like phospholipase family protein [Candidatus Omnitrophota bacterium]
MEFSLGPESHPQPDKIDKISFLSLCPLFAGLSQWELQSISRLTRLVEYKKDETVYEEGGPADSFYIVVSGRFEVSLGSLDKKKVLAYIRRGDYFGEMALLTHEPHSATLRALSDSLLLQLKKEDFKRITESSASVSLEISRRLSSRVKGIETRSRLLMPSDIVTIFSNQNHVGRTEFSINLAASLFQETRQKTVLLDMSPSGSEISAKLHMAKKVPIAQFHNISNAAPGALANFLVRHPVGFEVLSVGHEEGDALGEAIIVSLLNHLAIDYRFIIIDLPHGIDGMVIKALKQSDTMCFLTDSSLNNVTETRDIVAELEKNLSFPENRISIVINEVLMGIRTTVTTKRELFGDKPVYSLPATKGLGEREEASSMPFVVSEPAAEYSRVVRHMARRISHNLVGLVLGSGAALGLAHIGVLKVLERENIPIDMISGSSIGALIGSLYAVGKSSPEIQEAAEDVRGMVKFSQLLDVSLYPVRGLLDGRRIVRHFRKHLGNKTFDDCRIPLKIVGANLSTRQIKVFETGFIADAVRASIAIPAIFKPVFMYGDWVVDGGILSPLPIETLRRAGANKIIAVNVFPTLKDILERKILIEEAAEKEEGLIRQKNFVVQEMHRIKKFLIRRFTPNVFDILMNTIQSMETQIAEIEGASADLVIRPVVPNASWVDFFKPEIFIKRGEEEAARALSKIKALVSSQDL